MNQHAFPLANQPWAETAPGLREKSCEINGRRYRMVEFSVSFQEPDWCTLSHAGYVLEGEMVVDVDGTLTTFREGDVICLDNGVPHRHHSTIRTAVLFLIEETSSAPSRHR